MATTEGIPLSSEEVLAEMNTTETTVNPFMFWPPYVPGAFEVSLDLYFKFGFYSNNIASPIIIFIGLFGNVIGFYIMLYDKQWKTMSIYVYMLALFIIDILYLLQSLIICTFTIIETFDWALANRFMVPFSFAGGFIDFFTFHVGSLFLFIMSIERLHALVSPFTFKQSKLSNFPFRIIFGVVIAFFLLILPYPFCFYTEEFLDFYNNTFLLILTKPEMSEFNKHYGFVESILSLIYPIIMLLVNFAIVIAFRRFQLRRQVNLKNSSENNQQLKITIMVVCVTTLYVLLSVPKVFIQILTFVDDNYNFYGMYSPTFYFYMSLGDLFARLNAANDFIIYVLVSKRLRRLIRIRFCKSCISEQELKDWSEFQVSERTSGTQAN